MRIDAVSLALLALFLAPAARAGEIERIDGPNGVQPNGESYLNTISADGRHVALTSTATNLIPNDANGSVADVFVKDRQTGAVTLVSKSSTGVQSTYYSGEPVINATGELVVFVTEGNLVPGALDSGQNDVFLHDLNTGITELISVRLPGLPWGPWSGFPTISADGRYVVFMSPAQCLVTGDTNLHPDCFLRDRVTQTTTRFTMGLGGAQADGDSTYPNISADGRYVAFVSSASNLVANDTNGAQDVFRWDRITGTIDLVSVGVGGVPANSWSTSEGIGFISGDGRYVTFSSPASNLIAGDMNGKSDVFVRDLVAGITTRVSNGVGGVDADDTSRWPVISHDGRFISYESRATNLVPKGNAMSDVYEHDRVIGQTKKLSLAPKNKTANGDSFAPAVSADGHWVGFYSQASNLVPNDTNWTADIFLHSECWLVNQAFGVGSAGTGGVVPTLTAQNGACYPGGWSVTIDQVVGGAFGLLVYGAGEKDQFPVFGGHFYVDVLMPHIWLPLVVSGTPGQPGAGSHLISGIDLEIAVQNNYVVQFVAVDAGSPNGISMTNPARMTIDY